MSKHKELLEFPKNSKIAVNVDICSTKDGTYYLQFNVVQFYNILNFSPNR